MDDDWRDDQDADEDLGRPVRRMFRGDSFVLDVQVLRPSPGSPAGSPPVPTNITGWGIWFTVKRTVVDPDNFAVCQLVLGVTSPLGGIALVNALIGQFEITMLPIATRGMPDGVVRLVYDVQVRDLIGNDFTIEKGIIKVRPDVTAAI